MTYRHALVDVLADIEELQEMVEDAEASSGEFEKGFDTGFLEALDQLSQTVMDLMYE